MYPAPFLYSYGLHTDIVVNRCLFFLFYNFFKK